jgi:glycosyltransferase involved in cell wall biosynthesis
MNVMLFIKNLQGRGVSKVYINIAKGLKKHGYNPFIVLRENNIEVETYDLSISVINNDFTKNLENFISQNKIDFIISNNVKYLQNIANFPQSNIFYTVNMLWGERIFKQFRFIKLLQLRKEYYNKNIIASSNAVKNDLIEKLKIKPKKIEVIYDVFDFEEIEKKSNEFVPDIQNYILFIGAFGKEKNPLLLLKTYKKLNTDLKLLIIGKGKLENKMKKYIKKHNLQSKVKFLDFQKNPYPYIKHAKLTLLTSSNEALHGVAVESLYLNTPVVSTDSKGIRDVLTGELKYFIANSQTDLLLKTKKALKHYPEINKEKIKEKFGFNLINKYVALMEKK